MPKRRAKRRASIPPRPPRQGQDPSLGEGGAGGPHERLDAGPDPGHGWRDAWTVDELGSLVAEDPEDLNYKIKNGEGEEIPVLLTPFFTAECDSIEAKEAGLGGSP
jgi:hypothetical protein